MNIKPELEFFGFFNIQSIIFVAIISLTVSGLGVVAPHLAYAQKNPSSSAVPLTTMIDGIQCNTIEQLLFHIHAHLDVFINGQAIYIPPQIGIIPDKCIYWLHTHDEKGIIHIESPIKRDFTLGQFFDIWSKKLNNSSSDFANIFGGKSTPDVYVNGQKVTGVNYREIKLHAHD